MIWVARLLVVTGLGGLLIASFSAGCEVGMNCRGS